MWSGAGSGCGAFKLKKKSSTLGCKEFGRWKVGDEASLSGVWRINAMGTQMRE